MQNLVFREQSVAEARKGGKVMRVGIASWSLLVALAAISCTRQTTLTHVSLGPAILPATSFEKASLSGAS
jgi:hypothetical protein